MFICHLHDTAKQALQISDENTVAKKVIARAVAHPRPPIGVELAQHLVQHQQVAREPAPLPCQLDERQLKGEARAPPLPPRQLRQRAVPEAAVRRPCTRALDNTVAVHRKAEQQSTVGQDVEVPGGGGEGGE